jgi:hypothetical protein
MDLPPHPDTITRTLKKLSKDAGLPDIDLHDLCRAYLTTGRKASGAPSPLAIVVSFDQG